MTRPQRFRLGVSWALRDARRRWVQVISIGLLLALGVGMYSAMSSMGAWRIASADASFAALRSHDLRVSLVPGSYVGAGRLRSALVGIPDRGSVSAAEERLIVPTQVDASHGRRSIIVPGRIVGMPISPGVDQLASVSGRPLRPADAGRAVVELERSLRAALPGVGYTFTAGGQEAARRLLYKDAEGDQQMMDIFAALLLGAAAFAAFNLISRTIEAQRREIGIGMALGVRPRVLARRPLLLGAQVALLGIVLGIPAGFAANAWLRSVMLSFFPLPVL